MVLIVHFALPCLTLIDHRYQGLSELQLYAKRSQSMHSLASGRSSSFGNVEGNHAPPAAHQPLRALKERRKCSLSGK